MPAIEFSKLRTKIGLLGQVFDRPEQFIKDLSDLYFFYSDLTFQSNATLPASSTVHTYRIPVVINRELEHALKKKTQTEPDAALLIIDALWKTQIEEPCKLAAALLGELPLEMSEAVLQRIQDWSESGIRTDLVSTLQNKGTETIRRKKPELWLQFLKKWYESKLPARQKLAIAGLCVMIDDPNFTNLPIAFDFMRPVFDQINPQLTIHLLSTIETLARKSEPETVFFLKKVLNESPSQDLPRLIRRGLPIFSDQAQKSLKNFLRESSIS